MSDLQKFFKNRDDERKQHNNEKKMQIAQEKPKAEPDWPVIRSPLIPANTGKNAAKGPESPTEGSFDLVSDNPLLRRKETPVLTDWEQAEVSENDGLPYYAGTSLGVKKPGDKYVPIPKEQRKGASLEGGIKAAMYGIVDGYAGEEVVVKGHNALMKYLFGSDEKTTVEDYEKKKITDITGNANNELTGTEEFFYNLGQIAGNLAAYKGTNKAVSGVGSTKTAAKAGTFLKNLKPVKVLSDTKIGKSAGKVLQNPHVQNLIVGQAADTIVQTPRVISKGVREGKSFGEIAGDVAKQQATDLAWNAGFETVGSIPEIINGGKKLVGKFQDARVQKAVTDESVQGILKDTPGREVKNGIFSSEGLSDNTITAVRKIQTLADAAGKDFSEIVSAVRQGKTMKNLQPEIESFANWAIKMDSPGYIKRIDFDDAGKIRIDRSPKYFDNFFGAQRKDGGTFEIRKKDLDADVFDAIKQIQKIADQTDSTFSETLTKMVWNGEYRIFDEPLKKFSTFLKEIGGDGEIERIDISGLGHAQVYQAGYHTPDMVKTIREYKNSTDKELIEYVEKAIRGEKVKPEYKIGKPSQSAVIEIKNLTGIDVSDYDFAIVPSKAEHLHMNHMMEAGHTASWTDMEELARVGYVLENYDDIRLSLLKDGTPRLSRWSKNSDNSYAKQVIIEKQVNGTVVSVVAVPDNKRKLLQIETAYKKRTQQVPSDRNGSFGSTSETKLASVVPTYSIPYKGETVKSAGSNSFISGELAKLSDSEIEAVIKEENLPFRNARDVRKSAAFLDAVTKDKSGHSLIGLDSAETTATRKKLFSGFYGKTLDWLEDNFVNRHAVVKIFDRVDSSTSTDDLLQLYRQSGSTSEYIKKVKLVDLEGKEVGKSLDEIFSGIRKKDRKAFDEYLFHKYNFERWYNGVPLEVDVTQGESLKAFTKLERLHPEFKKTAEELYQFNRELNRAWALDTGIMTKAQFDNQNAVYPSYVPTFREFGGKIDNSTAEKTSHGVMNIFQKAETRHEIIYDVKRLMENKIDILVNAGRKQQLNQDMVLKVLHNPSKLSSVGKILDPSKEIKNASYEAAADGINLVSNLKQLQLGKVDDHFTMSAYIDGNLYTIGISERLHNAFSYVTAGGNQKLKVGSQILIDFWGKHVTGNFKKLVTGLNPYFAGRNVFRDAPNALITTTGGMGEMAKAYPEAISKILKHDETFKQFCALGGADTGILENVEKALTQRNYNPILLLQKFNGFTEAIPRYAEFLMSLRHGDDIYAALKNAAEVTVNFSRGGRLSKNVDKLLVPYFNARLQGFYKSLRQFKGWKATKRTLTRSTIAITIPTVFCYVLNKGNPHYEDLTERQKNYYMNIPDFAGPKDTNGYPTKFFKVPKTEQFGFVFGSMVERGLRAAFGDDEAFDNLWENFSDGLLPFNTRNFTENFYSPAWKGIVENMIQGKTDILDFAGRPVIPEDMRNLPPEKQYDETTSKIGIWIGEKIGVSPKVVDYLIKSYSGFVGETVLPYFQQNVENPMLQPWKKSFTVDSLYSNDIPTTWHNLYSEMKQLRNKAKNAGNYREYYRYAEYVRDIGQGSEKAKQYKILIDAMIRAGASKDSESVRILRNQYLDEYKKVIRKYESILKGE